MTCLVGLSSLCLKRKGNLPHNPPLFNIHQYLQNIYMLLVVALCKYIGFDIFYEHQNFMLKAKSHFGREFNHFTALVLAKMTFEGFAVWSAYNVVIICYLLSVRV